MAVNLAKFRIEKLHGYKTVDIEIINNRLVIVGENGTGKTTVINLIYYFLSGQWHRMKDVDFESINAVINDSEFNLSKEQLIQTRVEHRHFLRHLKQKFLKNYADAEYVMDFDLERVYVDLLRLKDKEYSREYKTEYIWSKYRVPRSMAMTLVSYFQNEGQLSFEFEENEVFSQKAKLADIVTEQILYLPTYRRIEQELGFIFPQSEVEDFVKKINRRREISSKHIELIEFGMKDVDTRIEETMKELKDKIRGELNNLTGSYLSEVVGGKYKSVDTESIKDLQSDTIESMLSRIDDNVLPEYQKEELKKILGEIKSANKIEDVDQKVIAHFLLKLFEVNKIQAANEKNINNFIKVCNKYLVNKKIVYDNNDFKIEVKLDGENPNNESPDSENSDDCNKILLKQLSSGEKQIISLFSHLFLSPNKQFFVLIDEPELSLSVLWQKDFLPDILNSGYCTGLIAVTHSPFIFENELDSSAHSINEFLK